MLFMKPGLKLGSSQWQGNSKKVSIGYNECYSRQVSSAQNIY